MRILITGGAGFVGASLARAYRERHPRADVVVLDNLRRRGSELNLESFRREGIEFRHGDIRSRADLQDLTGQFDLMVEASAEPSVHAGLDGSPQYLLDTNLVGSLNCLEFARERVGAMIFLSTSRVYSIAPLRAIALEEAESRFEIAAEQVISGVGPEGISEAFPVLEPRSLYGATKLASELFIQEYAESFKLRAVINRCGVIAGPGQFGKVDQGVFTLWVANHFFGKPLRYTGFGGTGKQVRDLLHPADLFELLEIQLDRMEVGRAESYNVGGGRQISTSLTELTEQCRRVTGRTVEIGSMPETNPVDVPLYISDCSRVRETFGWSPARDVGTIVSEIHAWLAGNEVALRPIFA